MSDELAPAAVSITRAAAQTLEVLPFTVRVVRDDYALLKAVQVRHAAYARHKPAWADRLRLPEPDDTADDCVVLLAESKWDGRPLGSVRMQVNDRRPLPVERQAPLPAGLKGRRLADAWRLSLAQGPDANRVKMALFKAYFLCLRQQAVDWSVVAARSPLHRLYESLLFQDLFAGETIALEGTDDPHRVLAIEMASAEQRWARARHPLLDYMVNTRHPDIAVT